ncbi:MAG: exosortase/archaeosortase family protein [Nitrospira sp.]|nr:exosortase/archaeosortase family protein [Nitrospira sp.]
MEREDGATRAFGCTTNLGGTGGLGMTRPVGMKETTETSDPRGRGSEEASPGHRAMGLAHAPCLLILGWWVGDLQLHWRALPEFQHGWLVVPLALFLAWERWPGRPSIASSNARWGPLMLAMAMFPLVLVAELYQHAVAPSVASSFALSVGCAGYLVAILWLVDGWPVARHFLFPILFLFVAVPIPKIVWNPVVFGLQGLIAVLNVETLNLIGVPATRSGNLIVLPQGMVGVDEACSGIRSLQSSIMAALFIADLTLRRVSLKVLFVLIGVVLALMGNFGRSLYLSMTAARHGVDAVIGAHDAAGWSVLVFTTVGLAIVGWRILRAERAILRESAGGERL